MRPPFRRETCLRLLLLALIPSFPGSGHAQQTRAPVTATLRSGTLSFSAHATAGDFVGTTSTVSGMVSGSAANPQGWVEAPVMTLTTHNDRRDRDMRASLEAPTYPTIRFNLTGATVTASDAQGNPVSATLHGTLAIHGVTRDVSPPATIVLHGDTILVVATFPLDVRDYKVGGLTKLLGILRMDPMIGVRADLRFVANQARTTDAAAGWSRCSPEAGGGNERWGEVGPPRHALVGRASDAARPTRPPRWRRASCQDGLLKM